MNPMLCRALLVLSVAWTVLGRPRLPAGLPLPAPSYMVDNTGNYFGVAPDRGSPDVSVHLSRNETLARLTTESSASDSFWLANIKHGTMPYAPKGYQVFRNVKDFSAKGDGRTDDTAAINKAISSGNRCGKGCNATSVLGAVIYFPKGVYTVSSPLVQYYYTQFVGDAVSKPAIKGLPSFAGIALSDTDPYIAGGGGSQWYINQNNFFRQIRNFVIDLTAVPREVRDREQVYVPTGIHWQVAQATSLQNIDFKMPVSDNKGRATAVGIFMENGSGGFVSDLTFHGGNIGMRAGSQQFTARNLKLTSCLTAISMVWSWGWTWKNIEVVSCHVAINCTGEGGAGSQGTGSMAVVDSYFDGVPQVITLSSTRIPGIILDNVRVTDSPAVVSIDNGRTILGAPSKGSKTIQSWALGKAYTGKGEQYSTIVGNVRPAPIKPKSLLDQEGNFFTRSKPQYENLHLSDFLVVTDHYGIKADGTGDQANGINKLLAEAKGRVVYFPAGIYRAQSTIFVPVGSRIVGEAWSQIVAAGNSFQDEFKPRTLIKVGNPGDTGILEISDMLFTVSGPTAGAVLMEWNVHESFQGSAAMWDSHFRVGGAVGSQLQAKDCPKLTGKVLNKGKAASLMMRVTTTASGYFENIWLWVADHDIDTSDQKQIDVYGGRGLAQPFQLGTFNGDPTFKDCPASLADCTAAWALRIISSRKIFIYGAGMYSFFQNYRQDCVSLETCQQRLVETSYSEAIWMYDVFTKGAREVISPQGDIPRLEQRKVRNGYCTAVSAWLELALTGANKGDKSATSSKRSTASTTSLTNSMSMGIVKSCKVNRNTPDIIDLDNKNFSAMEHWRQMREVLLTLSQMITQALDDRQQAMRREIGRPSLGAWQQALRNFVEFRKLQVNDYLQNAWFLSGGLFRYFACTKEGSSENTPCPSSHGGPEMPPVHAVLKKEKERAFFDELLKDGGFAKEIVLSGGSDYMYANGGLNPAGFFNPSPVGYSSSYRLHLLNATSPFADTPSDLVLFPINGRVLSPALGSSITNFPTVNEHWTFPDLGRTFDDKRAKQLDAIRSELKSAEKKMDADTNKVDMANTMDLMYTSQIPIYALAGLAAEMRKIREIGDMYGAQKIKKDALTALAIIGPLIGGALGIASLAGVAGMGSLAIAVTSTPVVAGVVNVAAERGSVDSLAYLGSAIEGILAFSGVGAFAKSETSAIRGMSKAFTEMDVKALETIGVDNVKRVKVVDMVMGICRRW